MFLLRNSKIGAACLCVQIIAVSASTGANMEACSMKASLPDATIVYFVPKHKFLRPSCLSDSSSRTAIFFLCYTRCAKEKSLEEQSKHE